jgi:exosortase
MPATTLSPARLETTSGWHDRRGDALRAAIIASLTAALYGGVLLDLASDWWHEPSLSQGLLIPPLALYIAWLRRRYTLSLPAVPSVWGVLLIAFACALLLCGKLAAEFFLARISFVLLLTGLVWTFWGTNRLCSLTFPFFLLATMVPLPTLVYNTFALPLQLLASHMATEIARWFGVAVAQDGNVIRLASVSLGVEEACSGLTSLSSLLVASVLLGFLLCERVWARVILLLLTVPISIGINIVRVAGSAILADYNPQFAMGFYHAFEGWLVFVCGALATFGAAKILGNLSCARSR